MEQSYTITQLAAILDVPRQQVYRFLTAENVQPIAGAGKNKTKRYGEDAKNRAAAHFTQIKDDESPINHRQPRDESTLVAELRAQIADLKEQRDKAQDMQAALIATNHALLARLTAPATQTPQNAPEAAADDKPAEEDATAQETAHETPEPQAEGRQTWRQRLANWISGK